MIDRIVVVDSGQVIETTESAIIAKDEADRAEKWAKYSEEQANLASNNAIAAAASKEAAAQSAQSAAQSAQSAANTVNGFDVHASEKQQDFDDNAESKTNTYNSNASTLLQQYTDNAAQKLSAYNSNDATKTQAFNDNYTAKLNAFNSNATTKTNDFNSNASEKQAQVDASVETARKWAIGTIQEQPNGSAKYWAEQAKTATAGTLNESILTNCLTEIPQDIKLELSNGTLTLKAGSKVYVPNGVGKFDIKTLSKDLQYKGYYSDTRMIVVNSNLQGLDGLSPENLYAGNSAPKNTEYMFWYDTANNIIKLSIDTGSSWTGQYSLPICIETSSSSAITSIDQVFNGFGYVGDTIFALPGIKGRVPNGFSTDGKPNSIELTTTKVSTRNVGANQNAYGAIGTGSSIGLVPLADYKYDYITNTQSSAGTVFTNGLCAFIYTSDSTGRITSLTPNTAFHAVDYSEYAREVDRCAKVDEDNEFTGNNSFLSNSIILKNISIDRDINPTKNLYAQTVIRDKNDKRLGNFYVAQRTDGSTEATMLATGRDGRDAKISISTSADGTFSTNVPTPPISDNGGQIATTAWVNNKFQKVSTLPAQPDPNVTYLIPEE